MKEFSRLGELFL